MIIDSKLLDELSALAKKSPRLRQAFDLRTTVEDKSQRMLNALQPGTVMPIHRHPNSSETIIIVRGSIEELFYDNNKTIIEKFHLNSHEGIYGLIVPLGIWHNLICLEEDTIIFSCKDGAYEPLTENNILV